MEAGGINQGVNRESLGGVTESGSQEGEEAEKTENVE